MGDRRVRYSCMECKICYLPYSETAVESIPVVLPCGHVVCKGCVTVMWAMLYGCVKCPHDGLIFHECTIDQFSRCYAIQDLIREVAEEEAQAARAAAPPVAVVADPPVNAPVEEPEVIVISDDEDDDDFAPRRPVALRGLGYMELIWRLFQEPINNGFPYMNIPPYWRH